MAALLGSLSRLLIAALLLHAAAGCRSDGTVLIKVTALPALVGVTRLAVALSAGSEKRTLDLPLAGVRIPGDRKFAVVVPSRLGTSLEVRIEAWAGPQLLASGSAKAEVKSGAVTVTLVPAAADPCGDGQRNGDETDLDCGGPTCAGCALGGACLLDTDCASQRCTQKSCGGFERVGPAGGPITAIVIDRSLPERVFLGTFSTGVLRSSDGGRSFRQANQGLGASDVNTLVAAPSAPTTLYAVTDHAVFRSADSAATWVDVTGNLPDIPFFALVVDPKDPQRIYLGSNSMGVFVSTSGGTQWKTINSGLTDLMVYALAIDPQSPLTLYAGANDSRIFKSSDGGGTWKLTKSDMMGNNVRAFAIDPQNPMTVYAAIAGQGVVKTVNGGGQWSLMSDGLTDRNLHSITLDPKAPEVLYAGTISSGFWKSVNGGGRWGRLPNGLPTTTWGRAIAIHPTDSKQLFAATQVGCFASANAGVDWEPRNQGVDAAIVFSIALDPGDRQTLYAGTSGGVFRSLKGGRDLVALPNGLEDWTVRSVAVDPVAPTTIYAGTEAGVFKSTNRGDLWTRRSTGLTDTYVRAVLPDRKTRDLVYAGTSGGLFRSLNGGDLWSPAGLAGNDVRALAVHPTNPALIYAATTGGGLFQTLDGGKSWTSLRARLPELDLESLAIDPLQPERLFVGTNGKGLFFSGDAGSTWQLVLDQQPVSAIAIAAKSPSTIYATVFYRGPYRSQDSGKSFVAQTLPIVDPYVYSVAIDPEDAKGVYIGTDHGLFITRTGGE